MLTLSTPDPLKAAQKAFVIAAMLIIVVALWAVIIGVAWVLEYCAATT